MLTITRTLVLSAGALGLSPVGPNSAATIPFDEARILLEFNASDLDAEIVVEVDADVGLARFLVLNPDGKPVLNLRARDNENLGIRKIALETPEPTLAEVLAAYPEGIYTFLGRSVDGEALTSTAILSHALPQAPVITYPREGDSDVPVSGASASWTAGADAVSFFFELENDDLAVDVKSNLAGGTTLLGFPEGFLLPATEYQLGIAARSDCGNLTVVEIEFSTAP